MITQDFVLEEIQKYYCSFSPWIHLSSFLPFTLGVYHILTLPILMLLHCTIWIMNMLHITIKSLKKPKQTRKIRNRALMSHTATPEIIEINSGPITTISHLSVSVSSSGKAHTDAPPQGL